MRKPLLSLIKYNTLYTLLLFAKIERKLTYGANPSQRDWLWALRGKIKTSLMYCKFTLCLRNSTIKLSGQHCKEPILKISSFHLFLQFVRAI